MSSLSSFQTQPFILFYMIYILILSRADAIGKKNKSYNKSYMKKVLKLLIFAYLLLITDSYKFLKLLINCSETAHLFPKLLI